MGQADEANTTVSRARHAVLASSTAAIAPAVAIAATAAITAIAVIAAIAAVAATPPHFRLLHIRPA